jgi:hypothetical protein
MSNFNPFKSKVVVVCLLTAFSLILLISPFAGVRLEPQRLVLSYVTPALAHLPRPLSRQQRENAAAGLRRGNKCVLTLVSGIGKTVKPEDLSVFVQSWRRFSPETKIAMFVDERDLPLAQSLPLQAILSPTFGVELIPYVSPPGEVKKTAKFHRWGAACATNSAARQSLVYSSCKASKQPLCSWHTASSRGWGLLVAYTCIWHFVRTKICIDMYAAGTLPSLST